SGYCLFGDLADWRIGRVPSPIRFGRVDLLLTVRRHAPGVYEARDVPAVHLTPHALRGTGSKALQEGLLVERLFYAVDPTPAERNVESLRIVDGRQSRALLVNLEPDLRFTRVVRRHPFLEGAGGLEALDLPGIRNDGRHVEICAPIPCLVLAVSAP